MPQLLPSPAHRATLARTCKLWLFSNLGGTLGLTACLSLDRFDDYPVALMTGIVAAIVSLGIVPLVLPFFALMSRYCAGWTRCYVAMLGVVLFFFLANEALLFLLPVDSVVGLLGLSLPYLVAALLTVTWLYSPAQRTTSLA